MLYFAYGSNLDPDQMTSRCPGHQVVGLAVMHDHKMIFPLTSHDWGGGVAGVQMQHGAELWGMVFELTDSDLAALDRYEGFKGPGDQHNLYDRETVFVELTRPDDGSFTRRLGLNWTWRLTEVPPAMGAVGSGSALNEPAPVSAKS